MHLQTFLAISVSSSGITYFSLHLQLFLTVSEEEIVGGAGVNHESILAPFFQCTSKLSYLFQYFQVVLLGYTFFFIAPPNFFCFSCINNCIFSLHLHKFLGFLGLSANYLLGYTIFVSFHQ